MTLVARLLRGLLLLLACLTLAFIGGTGGRRVVPSHPGRAPAALPVVVEPRAATHVLGVLLGLGVPILGGILGLVARLRRQKNQPPQLPAAPKHPQLSASRVPQQLHGAPEQRNVVMFGQTGSGKSTSGNHLVEKGKEVFKVSDGMSSETKGFEVADSKHYCYCEQDRVSLPYELQVYDTQGFNDTTVNVGSLFLGANQKQVKILAKMWEETPGGIHAFVYVARYGRLTQEDGQLARAVSKYVFDGMQGSERHCFMVFTHCPEKVLRKSGKEKEKWLGEQCEQNSHLRAMYQIVGHKPERVFLVDHEADPKQVRSVYAGLRQRIFDIHEPLKWDHEQLLEKFQLLEKEIERERKQKAEAVEKLEKECRRLQDQVEKAGEDDKATKEKIKKLESEKEQLEINSNKKIQNFENQKKATTAAYSLSNVSKASSGSTGSSSCFGGSCQIQVHGNLRDLVCGDVAQTPLGWSQVVAWLHRDPDAPTDMVEIVSAAATLAATRNHLLFRPDGSTVPAGQLRPGDWLLDGKGGCQVVAVRKVVSPGYFAPLTENGCLLVSGIAASCYIQIRLFGVTIPHHVMNLFMAPFRFTPSWLPNRLFSIKYRLCEACCATLARCLATPVYEKLGDRLVGDLQWFLFSTF